MRGRKRESQAGAAVREHGLAEAERLLAEGMKNLDLNEGGLESLPKLAPEKKVLAAWVTAQTLVGTEWVAERLKMGHRSNVSAAKKWVKESPEGQRALSKLVKMCSMNQP